MGEDVLDGLGLVFDIVLFHETDGFVPFIEFAFDDTFCGCGGFAFGLGRSDLFFFVNELSGNVLASYIEGGSSCDVHAEVFGELFEFVVFGNEVGFAIEFDHYADAATHMDVGLNGAFGGLAVGFFSGGGHAFLFENGEGFFVVAVGFDECFFAFDEANAGLLAQVVNHLSGDGLL